MDHPDEPTSESSTEPNVEPAPAPDAEPEDNLTATERGIIALEKRRFRYQGSKEQAITRDLGIPVIAYYQQLNTMMDDPRVIAAEPDLMNRLRARRDALT